MYCNKVKKGKHWITYMLQLNLTKLNLDRSSSVRRIFQFPVVKTLPCSGCFTALPHSETGIHGSDDSLWHGSEFGQRFDRISAHVITRDWSVSMQFWYWLQLQSILTIIYVIREMESVMILQFVKIYSFQRY